MSTTQVFRPLKMGIVTFGGGLAITGVKNRVYSAGTVCSLVSSVSYRLL